MSGIGISAARATGRGRRIGALVAAAATTTALLIGGSFALALDVGSTPGPFQATDDDPLLGTPGEMDIEEISVTRSVMARRPAQPAFVFTVRNDSTVASVEITRMSDAALGELDGRGNCDLPQTLAASELYTCHVNTTGTGIDMPFAGVTVLAQSDSGAWLAGWARTPESGIDEARNSINTAAMAFPTSAATRVFGASTNASGLGEQELLLID